MWPKVQGIRPRMDGPGEVDRVPTRFRLMELPDMMSTKYSEFLPPPPCPHLDLIYTIKFTQPPLLRLHFHGPLPHADVISGISQTLPSGVRVHSADSLSCMVKKFLSFITIRHRHQRASAFRHKRTLHTPVPEDPLGHHDYKTRGHRENQNHECRPKKSKVRTIGLFCYSKNTGSRMLSARPPGRVESPMSGVLPKY